MPRTDDRSWDEPWRWFLGLGRRANLADLLRLRGALFSRYLVSGEGEKATCTADLLARDLVAFHGPVRTHNYVYRANPGGLIRKVRYNAPEAYIERARWAATIPLDEDTLARIDRALKIPQEPPTYWKEGKEGPDEEATDELPF